MEKKTTKTFREYAHKWRDLAAQVQPLMTNKKLNKMFLNTLKTPYYDRMIGNSYTNFSDMVSIREMIENRVKLGKIDSTEVKKPTLENKERRMRCHTKGRHIIPLTHNSQTGATSHTINMLRAAHKGTTSPTLGQWHIFPLCQHQLME